MGNETERDRLNSQVYDALMEAHRLLRKNKPNDRSDIDRAFAVAKTQLEVAMGYYYMSVVCGFVGLPVDAPQEPPHAEK